MTEQGQSSINICSDQIDRPLRYPAREGTQLWIGITAFCAGGMMAASVLLGGGSKVAPAPATLVSEAPDLVQTATASPEATRQLQLKAVVIRQ